MDYSTKFISAGKDFSTFFNYVPAPYIRKCFDVDFMPEKAEMLVCGLGLYEFYFNGKRLTNGRLAPYISNPNDILYYDRYDLSGKMVRGKNTIAFILGNGMQNAFGGDIWDFQLARWRSSPKLALRFIVEGNGKKIEFEADESFKTAPSPTYLDDLRIGDFYNANNEIDGWNLSDFDDCGWKNAIRVDAPSGECREGVHSHVIDKREITPKRIFKGGISRQPDCRESLPAPTVPDDEMRTDGYIYDFGENCAGRVRLKIKGKKGQKIILQFGEKLWDNGIDLSNMTFLPRGLDHRCIYICKGIGEETFEPMFSYFGFQYCLVIGIDETQATEDLLTYIVMHGDFEENCGFTCSDKMVNKLQQAVVRTDLANLLYFPTDCPHREKNGWTGDAQLSCEQFLMNLSVENTLREWLFNIRKAQDERGALPGIVPTGGWGFEWGNGPVWDAVLTELPYRIWQYRGDTEILEENAYSIFRYISYLTTRRDEKGLIHIGLGDWCPVGDKVKSPLEFTDSATSMNIALKAAKIFTVINRPLWAQFANNFADEMRTAIRENLIDMKTLTVAGNCQTSQSLALYCGIFNDDEKQKAFDVLLSLIHAADDSIDVGFIGTRVIIHVLSEFGYDDLALHMITKPEYPSWGNWIARGANTLWENFCEEPENGWSNNHHAFGDISAWFIKNLAGIIPNPECTDENYLIISPAFVEALSFVDGWYKSPCGKVSVRWDKTEKGITLKITVPDGINGKIKLRGNYKFAGGENEIPIQSGIFEIE
jgi:alpha-L-rhamnosidase